MAPPRNRPSNWEFEGEIGTYNPPPGTRFEGEMGSPYPSKGRAARREARRRSGTRLKPTSPQDLMKRWLPWVGENQYKYGYGSLVPPGPGMKPGEDFMLDPDFRAEAGLLNREYLAALEDYRQRLAIEEYQAELRRAPVRRNIEIEQIFGPQGQAAIGEVYGNLTNQLTGMLPQFAAPYEQAAAAQQGITGSATGALGGQLAAIQNQLAQQAGLSGVGFQEAQAPAGTAPVGTLGALQLALQQQAQGGGENIAAMQQLGAAEQALTQQAIGGYGAEMGVEQGYLQDEVAAAIANLQAELAGIQASPVPFNMEDINIPHERKLRDLMKEYMDRQKAEMEEESKYAGLRGVQEYLTKAGVPELQEDFMDKYLEAQRAAAGSAGEFSPEEALVEIIAQRPTTPKRFGATVRQIHPDEYQRLMQTLMAIMGNQYGGF